MATDIEAITGNVRSFHDMTGKSVVHVGAGGGQLVGCVMGARSVLAVDSDRIAASRLETAIRASGSATPFRVVHGEFSAVTDEADVIFFEFCLHEMDSPEGALLHAQSLASEILILDHLPGSPWAWQTCEEDKAARSWMAVRRLRIVREASFTATQCFDTYSELLSKVQILGEQAVTRSRRFSGREDIRIEMGYAMALVRGAAV